MMRSGKFNLIVSLVLAVTVIMAMTQVAYANENEAYVYKYTKSEDFSNNDYVYADGSGSTPAYLRYVTGPEGQQQYGGYCADFESNVSWGSMYSRTTLGESGHFNSSVAGHLRAILANSVPVVSLGTLKSASGVSGLEYGEAVAATQWAIWAYTNPSSPEIAIPSKNGTSDKEKAAYYLYKLPPVAGGYSTEPVLMNIKASQDGNKMIFDYSSSTNIGALYDKVITVKDENGKSLSFTDENYKVTVDVSGLTKDQKVSIKIEGKQVLAADAYFYSPENGRMSSQSLISWFKGVTSVAGTAIGNYDVDKETTELILTGDKTLTGRAIDLKVDKFEFAVKDANGKTVATGKADADGDIVFTPIKYTKAMKGKTFTYTVRENAGSNPGIEYDGTVYSIKVTVGYKNGKVTTSVDYGEAQGIVFVNKYTTKDGSIALKVLKNMKGKELQEGMFQFTKVKCDKNGVPIEGAETETVTNTASGSVVFAQEVYGEEGVHYYLIKEINGGKRIDGITYDGMELVVKVTVTDNKLGQLVAEAAYPADKTFNNIYTADPDTVVLGGQKYLDGRPMEAGEFEFVVKNEAGEIVAGAVNDENGSFRFGPVAFNAAGTYILSVEEVSGTAEGVTYDNKILEVVVTVTDDGKGKLHAVKEEPEGGIVFNNKYVGPAQITVDKHFRINEADAAGYAEFEVGLFTDEACTVKALYADGKEVENQIISVQDGIGSVVFSGLEYGTYYVAEIGADGSAVGEGIATGVLEPAAYKQNVTYINKEVVLTDEERSGKAEIVNDFYTEEYYLQGKIRVTKQVEVAGEARAVDATYFAALFADPELTMMVSDIVRIEMGGQSEASVVFSGLEIYKTYYLAETDFMGVPIESGDYGTKNIVIENGVIEIAPQAEPVIHEAIIINQYDEEEYNLVDETSEEFLIEEFEEYEEEVIEEKDEKKEVVNKDKAVETGDDFDAGLALAVMAAALIGMAAVAFGRRKSEEK